MKPQSVTENMQKFLQVKHLNCLWDCYQSVHNDIEHVNLERTCNNLVCKQLYLHANVYMGYCFTITLEKKCYFLYLLYNM